MKFTFLCSLLGFVAFWLRLPIFETVAGILLTAPVVFYLAASEFGPSRNLYLFVILGVTASLMLLRTIKRPDERSNYDLREELITAAVFLFSFTVCHALCLCWPDFISIGERLRDYAILSSVIKSPVQVSEPWFAHTELNYYAYWYRVGHMFSSVLVLKTWDVYHQLQSFTYALYITCTFQILYRYLKFSLPNSAMCAALVAFGSNVAGVFSTIYGAILYIPSIFISAINYRAWFDDNWWGPSRVIEGAIDEFPSWSFVLGDLHPHYLNLPLIPFFVVLFLAICNSALTRQEKILASLPLAAVPFFWIYGSNVWEMPVWGAIMVGAVIFFTFLRGYTWLIVLLGAAPLYWKLSEKIWSMPMLPRIILSVASAIAVIAGIAGLFSLIIRYFPKKNFSALWGALVITLGVILCYSLYLASKNITPLDYPLSFVIDPIKRTPLSQLCKHWGMPLLLISWSLMFLLRQNARRVYVSVLLFSLIFFQEGLPFLIVIFAASLFRIYNFLRDTCKDTAIREPVIITLEVLGMAALGTVLAPEIIYLNDPYGPEIDRMNTIFKFYSAAWIFMHLYGFYLVSRAWQAASLAAVFGAWRHAIPAAAVVVFCFFFARTAALHRPSGEVIIGTAAEGLSTVEREFPGSGYAIQALRDLPNGTVLEAQGGAYSYTSFISTLSENFAYLGWANHVGLLYNLHGEVQRREKITKDFYLERDCEAKRAILTREQIAYAVLGSLERKEYPGIETESFSCLHEVVNQGEYRIYTP